MNTWFLWVRDAAATQLGGFPDKASRMLSCATNPEDLMTAKGFAPKLVQVAVDRRSQCLRLVTIRPLFKSQQLAASTAVIGHHCCCPVLFLQARLQDEAGYRPY